MASHGYHGYKEDDVPSVSRNGTPRKLIIT